MDERERRLIVDMTQTLPRILLGALLIAVVVILLLLAR